MYQDINSVEIIRDILDAIKIDQAFLRSRHSLEFHKPNNTDLKVDQDIQRLSEILIEEIKKAVDSVPTSTPDTDND